ncbi:Gfo/Idh/MocA family protein [Polaromonas sp.]|jgi:predicted dehydrogenase|uniref:Gfo/Idh/MocA family protein n=1 Tax=Polaromonas sp. TaxID=1869339 RepID=UPI0037C68B50
MKVLFIGLGGIGQRHLRNLQAIAGDDLEVIAYRERNASQVITDKLAVEEGADVQSRFGLEVFHDLTQALAEKPLVAFICNPTSMHMAAARAAAEHGCHLFIEKALSDSMAGVEELIALVEAKKLVCMVGYQMRFHPCLQALEKILKSGALGRIVAVNAEVGEYMPAWHKYEDYRQLYAARKDLGGGVIVSQIHEFDYIQWLFGLPTSVYAVGGHLSSLEIDVEDVASVTMTCVHEGRHIPVHLHQDYLQRPPTRTCKVVGDQGKVVLDFMCLSLTHYDRDGEVVMHADFSGFERNQLFIDQTRHFLECIKTGSEPCVTLRGGARSLQMALAAKRSLETGEVVGLGV